jgi:hypothetical protein
MIIDNNTNLITTAAPNDTDAIYDAMCFAPIDTMVNWRLQRFPFTMLQVGQILLKNKWSIIDVTATRISRIMERHRNKVFYIYTAGQICKEVQYSVGEIVGAGIRIECSELRSSTRSNPKYDFNFSTIYRPEDMVVKNNQTPEPTTVSNNQPTITQ